MHTNAITKVLPSFHRLFGVQCICTQKFSLDAIVGFAWRASAV